jgi:hypothetical protein
MMEPRAISALDPAAFDGLLRRGRSGDPDVARSVAELIEDVRDRGDAALRDQARRFDDVALGELEVPRADWTAALDGLEPKVRSAGSTRPRSRFTWCWSRRPAWFWGDGPTRSGAWACMRPADVRRTPAVCSWG